MRGGALREGYVVPAKIAGLATVWVAAVDPGETHPAADLVVPGLARLAQIVGARARA